MNKQPKTAIIQLLHTEKGCGTSRDSCSEVGAVVNFEERKSSDKND